MEKKKTKNIPIKKTTTNNKRVKNVRKETTKKQTAKKRTKRKAVAFTLIELLAVIIILGVIMLIAIPSITKQITNSRKQAYIKTVKSTINGAKVMVNSGDVEVYDTEATYYIPVSCIPTENSLTSPYGDFTKAYVLVTYNRTNFDFYWLGTDTAHMGINKIVSYDNVSTKDIKPNIKDNEIETDLGIGTRNKVIVFDSESCNTYGVTPIEAGRYVDTNGEEITEGQITIPGNYTLNNNYYYLGRISYGFSDYYKTFNVPFLDIPAGATEFLVYSIEEYSSTNTNYINLPSWTPVTIENGSFSCGSTSNFTGTAKYLPFPTTANNNYTCGENIENRVLRYSKKSTSSLISTNTIIAQDNKLVVTNFYTLPRSELYFKIKFRGPGFSPSEWYVKGLYVIPCIEANMEVDVYDEKKKKRMKKKIKDLTYDDLILVWDFDEGTFTYAKALWIKILQGTNQYHLLKFSDGSELKIVTDHRIFNVEKKMFTAAMSDDTPIGTTTLNSKGELVKLISKETIEEPCEFCNVITKRHINLFANGILTSWRLNNLYEIENLKFVKDNRVLNKREDFTEIDDEWFDGLRVSESRDSKEKILDDIKYCKKIQQ